MSPLPPEPIVPDEHRARGKFVLRYEDIGQTGHLLVSALPLALGRTGWSAVSKRIADETFQRTRILPILSRLVMETHAAPFSVATPLDAESVIQFAHTAGANGHVERLVVNMWCSVHGPAAHTHGFSLPNAGERLSAGRVFAEHVLTRPFDPPETRRVTEVDFPGFPPVFEERHESQPPETLLQLPQGATWLDDSFRLDAAPMVFGTDRTDANMHVNSLVYPRIFIDAALRRLWDQDKRGALRAELAEVAFRKPSFAGERVHVALRTFTLGQKLGAALMLIGNDEAQKPIELAKPRTFASIRFVGER